MRAKHHPDQPLSGDPALLLDASAVDAANHGELLLDESLSESFPASDPIAPAVPDEARRT
jgi:hypothetical protein